MVLAKKNGPPILKKGGKKGQGMKTGKNFVRGNKGPRPLMSLRPGPVPRGHGCMHRACTCGHACARPGFMRPGPFGLPPPGLPCPFFPPPPMMGCPPGPPGMFPHGPGPHIWGGPAGPMGPPPFRGPMVPPGPPGPMGGIRRGPAPLIPPPGLGPLAGPPGPRRPGPGPGPGPVRKPVGKNHMQKFPDKNPEPKIDFTEDTIDIQSNKLGTAF